MSNGGKSVLQELSDALAICMRVTDSLAHAHENTVYFQAAAQVIDARRGLIEAIRILVQVEGG